MDRAGLIDKYAFAAPGIRARLMVSAVLPGLGRLFTVIGLASAFVPDQAEQGLNQVADPSLEEVLAVRNEQAVELEQWLATVRLTNCR